MTVVFLTLAVLAQGGGGGTTPSQATLTCLSENGRARPCGSSAKQKLLMLVTLWVQGIVDMGQPHC